MPAELFRVDNRLIHGQVLEAWVPRVRAQAILVVDESASADPFQKSVLEAMGQCVISVIVTPPENAAKELAALGPKRVIVLFKDIGQAYRSHRAGLKMELLNLGNIHPAKKSAALTPSVNLTRADIEMLREMMKDGMNVEARSIPAESGPSVAAFLAEEGAA